MCRYWKKLHTCGDISDRPYIEMCNSGVFSNAVCPDISDDPKLRNSHFPCYSCIKNEARAELEHKFKMMEDAEAKAFEARQLAAKEKQNYEQRLKEERVRREAREKAAREREEEMRLKKAKEEEERKAKKEGGMWIETGSGKKSRARKSGGGAVGNPLSPVSNMSGSGGGLRENRPPVGGDGDKNLGKTSADAGGRAGTWGPKKILSRKENGGGAHGFGVGVHGNGNVNGNGNGNSTSTIAGNTGLKK
ncbi:hypothetical protein IAQ61_004008 [Plenodomus lingam]|uniref:Uncharacterized protein n=1 Tax=Leptosphaeria maculans (strain JN3 / isolate v23.1.3 / race Av1-4-5-6-7-8) TaxID=985895 RepID=E4ZRE3_LEPMJ|nr:hypothetical protein LEMA_P038110.1 [Plenodomus lingam JN3]KAH9874818.1 hypothetical protein IAQ61_004008 [Plenodomus lingam]CBX94137.1 hypothetical protein LEMA_P038110.1 [Plenodomus lingam JN3]